MIKIGDIVLCRLYNTPDKKFYGDYFIAVITNIMKNTEKKYEVIRKDYTTITLHRKEIKKIIK